MKTALGVFLLFAAVFLLWYEYFFLAILCFAVSLFIMLSKPAKSFGSGVMKELEDSEGQVPDMAIWEEGLKTGGAMAGEQTFADNENLKRRKEINVTKWAFKPKKVGDAGKKTIDLFKKLFG